MAIEDTWGRIEQWLADNAPEALQSLNAPASEELFDNVLEQFGTALPDDVVAVYRKHNGQDEESDAPGLFPNGDDYGDMAHSFASIETGLQIHQMMTELLESGDFADITKEPNPAIKTAHWNPLWFPVAHDGGGDYHCIDLDPGPSGIRGQVITVGESDTQTVVAPSLPAWLQQITDEMEAGALHVDEDYGLARWDPEE